MVTGNIFNSVVKKQVMPPYRDSMINPNPEIWHEKESIPQSIQFMIDCLPYIRKLLKKFPIESTVDFLDVGTGSGAGANLLGTLYRGGFFEGKYKIRLDALDWQEELSSYAKYYFPDINYITTDLFTHKFDKVWDIVFSSHMIEHTEDPKKFVEKLISLSKQFVLIYAPYEEDKLSSEHIAHITPEFAMGFDPEFVEVISSPAWYSITEDRKCIIFAIKIKE